ncbi:MAG: single-stranded-DNA-specific exonuclease RecJ [Planctomycetota bacterium]
MRGLTHRWIEPKVLPTDGVSGAWASAGLDPLVRRVLAARGITDPDEAARFCEPSLLEMHDPSLMGGLDVAAERLLRALRANERVVIYGDYDVDGVSATTILWQTLRHLAPESIAEGRVRAYVPHRLDEGYGINAEALVGFAEEGVGVVVSVDCGITAVEQARVAREAGLDLIVTDHHNPPADGALPDAFAVVHPRVGGAYPFGELCGAAVAFKLAWRLLTTEAGSERVGADARRVLLDGLALAGLATIADVVPLVDENRVIARHGLARVKHTENVGLRALIEVSGLASKDVGSEEAGYVLGPRLNACGRLGHAREAVELLTTDDPGRAQELARHLDKQNRGRRETEKRIFGEAEERVATLGLDRVDKRSIVLAGEGWHPGVVGIVCSRLVGRYSRPAVLLCDDGETASGSGRSIDGYNLHGALTHCSDLLTRFGGHDMAAGMGLASSDVPAFAERMGAHAMEHISEERLTPALRIDCGAEAHELTMACLTQLERVAPFGRANPAPSLLMRGLRVRRGAETMGAAGAHMQVRFGDGGSGSLRAVGWRMGEHAGLLREGMVVDAVVRPTISRWKGQERVELELRDVRLPDAALV